ncbi:uncharacterized protein EV420DRAFT_1483398 [Desarmillaria tabescens]|uniref:Uncharacterized protein n=1 Tax=Armillaria tabescens TaxID=1929756 RepID=A0AA39JX02_ARMTA|nr:uncharacterized protein EV420DRAFT_1483398 [Desarmillaria tabescens]KAK0448989.1 hypothetical protein EV420DRAFT_1483398 [Desarmillaria tabescens]
MMLDCQIPTGIGARIYSNYGMSFGINTNVSIQFNATALGYSVTEECPTGLWVLLLPSARFAAHFCTGSQGCNHQSRSAAGLRLYSVDHCTNKAYQRVTVTPVSVLIWHCWTAWGWSWSVVLVPIICTTLGVMSRAFVLYYSAFQRGSSLSPPIFYNLKSVNWAVLYTSLILTTLLWCTILIMYHILKISGIATVFQFCNEQIRIHLANVAAEMRGIAPTILVGRVAAGHTCPDNDWGHSRSTVASAKQPLLL